MLTRALSILLSVCFVSMSLSGFFILAGFEWNENYIAKQLCINRDKPQLHCNGKCYLMSKLKQAQDKEQKQEHQFQKIQLQEAITVLPFIFKAYSATAAQPCIPICTGRPVSQLNSIFHPPQIA